MIKQKIIAAYEKMAEKYNELIDHKPHNAYYDRPNTLSLLPNVNGLKVLDAACGPGKYAEILLDKGAYVTGFDISPKMVQLAQERNETKGHFFIHDLSTPFLSLQNENFDIVLCALAFHYVEDWKLTIREFHRILKPGGFVIISSEHPYFEYEYFKSKKYFDIEHVKAIWGGFGQKIEINSFRRPLQEYITPFTENGFYLDKLLEPKPTEEFKKLDPKHYKELNSFPAFLCLRFVKK